MKLAIIGAGAMGTLFGAHLALAGNEVTMIDVVPEVIEAINERGILLEDDAGSHIVPVSAARAEDMKAPVELAILFTKTVFSRSALRAAGTYVGPDTLVLTLQNGIGNEDVLAEFVSRDRILLGVTNYPSDLIGPGHVSSHGKGYVRFMSLSGVHGPELERVEETLKTAGLNAAITPDVAEAVWEKVAFNAVMNGTTAVCQLPVGGIAGSEHGVSLARRIAQEAVSVAAAYGVNVPMEKLWASVSDAFAHHGSHYPSMAQDVMKKRPTEIDAIHGGILARARTKGIPVPCIETICDLVHILQAEYGAE
ncbi:MAG: 2-dehydropantoate 2-reductase [Oscillospiraceae bacterium]|nr:2-dehydropantoate 2-reductase [Oscillospiraceae bacterium]